MARRNPRGRPNRRAVEEFAARLEVLADDADAADHAADIRARSSARRSIGGYDVLIAGHARSRGLIVVTGNPANSIASRGSGCEDW